MPEVVFENPKDGYLDRIVLQQFAQAATINNFSGHADVIFRDDVEYDYLEGTVLPAVKEAGYPNATLDDHTIHLESVEMSVLIRSLVNTPIQVLDDSWIDLVRARMDLGGQSIE